MRGVKLGESRDREQKARVSPEQTPYISPLIPRNLLLNLFDVFVGRRWFRRTPPVRIPPHRTRGKGGPCPCASTARGRGRVVWSDPTRSRNAQ